MVFQKRLETGDHKCTFVPNLPYAFISSTLTFWFPVILMVTVYYRVYREAMKQKVAMEKMTNIRTLPIVKSTTGKGSLEGEGSSTETFDMSNSRPKSNLISTPEKTNMDNMMLQKSENGSRDESVKNDKALKRISLDTAVAETRAKARNSVFASSGTNILEGMVHFII